MVIVMVIVMVIEVTGDGDGGLMDGLGWGGGMVGNG